MFGNMTQQQAGFCLRDDSTCPNGGRSGPSKCMSTQQQLARTVAVRDNPFTQNMTAPLARTVDVRDAKMSGFTTATSPEPFMTAPARAVDARDLAVQCHVIELSRAVTVQNSSQPELPARMAAVRDPPYQCVRPRDNACPNGCRSGPPLIDCDAANNCG